MAGPKYGQRPDLHGRGAAFVRLYAGSRPRGQCGQAL